MLNLLQTNVNPPQTRQARPDQVKNNAGGFVFETSLQDKLRRFLVLGASTGTYYVGKQQHFDDNLAFLREAVEKHPQQLLKEILEVSDRGLAMSNEPAIFALAVASKTASSAGTRCGAYKILPQVCRIPTHLFSYLNYAGVLGGKGMGTRKAIARWYNEKTPDQLAYQVLKYRQREGWTHRDALRVSHPKAPTAQHGVIYEALTKEDFTSPALPDLFRLYLAVQSAKTSDEVVGLVKEGSLAWEMIPTIWHSDPAVWKALLPSMPPHALIRNLSRLTSLGVIPAFGKGEVADVLVNKLTDRKVLSKARIHPFNVLYQMMQYAKGSGIRSSWNPHHWVVDLLELTYDSSFEFSEPTGKRFYLGLDVSGSMGFESSVAGMPARNIAAAIATVINRQEQHVVNKAFTHTLSDFPIAKRDTLKGVLTRMEGMPFGRTDCALLVRDAISQGLEVDAFVTITDNETWSGGEHPYKVLQEYRRKVNPEARNIVIGVTSTGFTIADPNDPLSLDVVGGDASLLTLITNFIKATEVAK